MVFDEKLFLLGIGAQKAGTSWLRDYLARRNDVYLQPNELHFFGLPDKGQSHRLKRLQRKKRRMRTGKARSAVELKLEQAGLFGDLEGYRNFFRDRVPEETHVFGEISPSYSLLGGDEFRVLQKLFKRSRIVFVMRDPIERLYSQMRMSRNKRLRRGKDQFDILDTILKPGYGDRSRYERTIRNLESVFSSKEILYLFYETLFCSRAIHSLCTFLGLPYVQPDFAKIVNPGGAREQILPDIDSRIREAFDETY